MRYRLVNVPTVVTAKVFPFRPQCICAFRMILTAVCVPTTSVNSIKPGDVCNTDGSVFFMKYELQFYV
jgi:hypothetical protein